MIADASSIVSWRVKGVGTHLWHCGVEAVSQGPRAALPHMRTELTLMRVGVLAIIAAAMLRWHGVAA
jgi:hypothetical protein